MSNSKLLYGVGVRDTNQSVTISNDGVEVFRCGFYQRWKDMMKRCYSAAYKYKNKSYTGCIVCQEWLTFSNFKSWMGQQDWEGKQLDKDLLGDGTLYSPETCCFISKKLNTFIKSQPTDRGLLIGTEYRYGRFRSCCQNPISKSTTRLGTFDTELEAHKAWQAKKHEYACQLANMQEDERVAKALRERYAPDKDWTNR